MNNRRLLFGSLAALALLAGAGCGRSNGQAEAVAPPKSAEVAGATTVTDETVSAPAPPPPPLGQGPATGELGESSKDKLLEIELSLGGLEGKAPASPKQTRTDKKPDNVAPTDETAKPQSARTDLSPAGLDKDEVAAVLGKELERFRPCLRQDAVVRVDADVGPDGSVLSATSERSTPDDPKLRECVLNVFKKLRFGARQPSSGLEPTRLRLDLKLRRGL